MKKIFTLILLSIILCVPQVMAQLSKTVEVATPGTLAQVLGDDKDQITELKIHGNINWADIMTIRVGTIPKLAILDMSEGGFEGNYVYKSAFSLISLKKIILPSSITYIDEYAFDKSTVEEIDLSRCTKLTAIRWYGFSNCPNLKVLDLSACTSLTGFSPCFQNLTCTLILPKNLKALHCLNDFKGTFILPDSLETIGIGALGGVTMSRLVLPESLQRIDDRSFENSQIEEIDFSNCTNLKSVGWYAFQGCSKLKEIDMSKCRSLVSFNPAFLSLNCKLILPENLTVLQGLGGFLGEVVIPNSIVTVGMNALGHVTMSPIVFSESLRRIDDRSFENSLIEEVDLSKCTNIEYVGWYAFKNSNKLKKLSVGTVIPPVAKGAAFEGVDFEKCILQVPYGSEDMYRGAGQWNQFRNIEALIPDTAALHDHLKLKTNVNNIHRAAPGETIRVYAKASNQRDLKIGLFDANGNLSSAIETSYKNSTYTCLIPLGARGGSYTIQPYYLTAGKVRMLERPDQSHLIDKLPLTIEEEDIWSKQSHGVFLNANISKHLQLKTAVKDLFEVAVEEEFQVYVPSTDAATTLGLFSLDGVFVTNIAASKKNQTYTCGIPFEVNAGNYIIMPYITDNGTISIVERAKGKHVADRLPLAVTDGDIWSRSAMAVPNEAIENNSLQLYPNPVSDVLYVGADDVSQIEIYDLTGRLVTKVSGTNTVSVSELRAGIYIVKVTTANGHTTHRVKKD